MPQPWRWSDIEATLVAGTIHYRNQAGSLLRTLDEGISAVLNNELVIDEAQQS